MRPGNPCPPRRSIHGKVAQVPAHILTLANVHDGVLGVAPVKNRYARAVADGSFFVKLAFDPATMWVADYRAPGVAA